MTSLDRVTTLLDAAAIAHALIGAAALAVHGVSRSTYDVDLLVTDARALDPRTWDALPPAAAEIRRGTAGDPVAGVVRVRIPDDREIDVVVGRLGWQHDILSRAERLRIGARDIPVARPADLVLLKLFAGGSQDAWDIEQLLAAHPIGELVSEVEARLDALPGEARRLWERIKGAG